MHLVKLPTPVDAPEEASPRPLWHKDLAAIDQEWADEAADVLGLLSSSNYSMVQSNAIGAQSAASGVAYSNLLREMQRLQDETVKENNEKPGNWLASSWDGLVSKFSKTEPLVVRMEKLLRARKILIDDARNRLNGLQAALDQRSMVDERAMVLLEKMPAIEERVKADLERTTQALAEVGEDQPYEVFRRIQLEHRAIERMPNALMTVREQLQNAVMLGAPLRDSIDQFVEIEQNNQNQFEISFNVHASNLAVLQGLQQSRKNAQASELVIQALPLPKFAALPAPEKAKSQEELSAAIARRRAEQHSQIAKDFLPYLNILGDKKFSENANKILTDYLQEKMPFKEMNSATFVKTEMKHLDESLFLQLWKGVSKLPCNEVALIKTKIGAALSEKDTAFLRLSSILPSGDPIKDMLPEYISVSQLLAREQLAANIEKYTASQKWITESILQDLLESTPPVFNEKVLEITRALNEKDPLVQVIYSDEFKQKSGMYTPPLPQRPKRARI